VSKDSVTVRLKAIDIRPKNRRDVYAGRHSAYLEILEMFFQLYLPGNDDVIEQFFDLIFRELDETRGDAFIGPIVLLCPWEPHIYPFAQILQTEVPEFSAIHLVQTMPKKPTDEDLRQLIAKDQLVYWEHFHKCLINGRFSLQSVDLHPSHEPLPIYWTPDAGNFTEQAWNLLRDSFFPGPSGSPCMPGGLAFFLVPHSTQSLVQYRDNLEELNQAARALLQRPSTQSYRLPAWVIEDSLCLPLFEPTIDEIVSHASVIFGRALVRRHLPREALGRLRVHLAPGRWLPEEYDGDLVGLYRRFLRAADLVLDENIELTGTALSSVRTKPKNDQLYIWRGPTTLEEIETVTTQAFESATFSWRMQKPSKKPDYEDSLPSLNGFLGFPPSVEPGYREGSKGAPHTSNSSPWDSIILPPEIRRDLQNRVKAFVSRRLSLRTGLLLYGPPGTGKTTIAKAMAKAAGCPYFSASLTQLKGAALGQSAEKVDTLWDKVDAAKMSILLIDECEAVFPERGSRNSDQLTDELLGQFLQRWEGLDENDARVLVIGATNRQEQIDAAIISRFGAMIEIPSPNEQARRQILALELAKRHWGVPSDEFVHKTAGMSGRDFQKVFDQAAVIAADGLILEGHLLQAADTIRNRYNTSVDPSATWDNLIIDADLKDVLRFYCAKLARHEEYQKKGCPPPTGLLLYGPPGTGKTQIARTLANESGLAFIGPTTTELKGKWIGDPADRIRGLFARARSHSPCILFLDELDAIAPVRGSKLDQMAEEGLTQLLQETDGISKRPGAPVFLIAATNVPDSVDSAMRSRFSKEIKISLPDTDQRFRLLELITSKKTVSGDRYRLLNRLAENTEGYSGRALSKLVEQAESRAGVRAMKRGEVMDAVLEDDDFFAELRDVRSEKP
jgi:SpoVK/Ycf46/Vps4 family AAA+-type ATPase